MSKWIAWHGLTGESPVDARVKIVVLFRNGEEENLYTADYFGWKHYGGDGDIVSYKIVEDAAVQPTKHVEPEYTGSSVSYYKVSITNPTTEGVKPYVAECNDLIEALNASFAEGNILKAIFRICAAKHLGKTKRGYEDSVYDLEKIVFFAQRLLAQERVKSMPSSI